MSDQPQTLRIHATAVAIDGHAVLLRGVPGTGKSDLALRLIDAGARLVADDQSVLSRRDDVIIVRSPERISGLIEVRGVGIMRIDAVLSQAPVVLIADMAPIDQIERMPPRRRETILGVEIPLIALAPFEASAPVKLRYVVRAFTAPGLPVML